MERHLQEKDIEDPLATQSVDSSEQRDAAADLSHSESSDIEQEQDFVSSVVSQRQGPRVHWGDLPKRTDEDKKGEQGKRERPKKQRREGDEEEVQAYRGGDAQRNGELREDENERQGSLSCETGAGTDGEKQQKLVSLNTDKPNREQVTEEKDLSEEPSVEEATSKLSLCSLSEMVTHTAPRPDDSTATHADLSTSPPCKDSDPSTESKHLPSSALISTHQDKHNTALTGPPGLNITQVGMSKRGAAGLRDLLKNLTAGTKPDSVRLNLLEYLRRTLKDWSTDATLQFLFGDGHSLGSPFADVKEEKEEDLDEDDLDDEETNEDAEGVDAGVQKKASAAAPDYKTLREKSQQLELRVKEFYRGPCILPDEAEEQHEDKVSDGGSGGKTERQERCE